MRERACELGHPTSCARIADGLAEADASPEDLARAAQFYDRACELGGDPMVCSSAALLEEWLAADARAPAPLDDRVRDLAHALVDGRWEVARRLLADRVEVSSIDTGCLDSGAAEGACTFVVPLSGRALQRRFSRPIEGGLVAARWICSETRCTPHYVPYSESTDRGHGMWELEAIELDAEGRAVRLHVILH